MKYKYTALFGILLGTVMNVLWGTVFSNSLGPAGNGVGMVFGVAFACCGCLMGYTLDKKSNSKDE